MPETTRICSPAQALANTIPIFATPILILSLSKCRVPRSASLFFARNSSMLDDLLRNLVLQPEFFLVQVSQWANASAPSNASCAVESFSSRTVTHTSMTCSPNLTTAQLRHFDLHCLDQFISRHVSPPTKENVKTSSGSPSRYRATLFSLATVRIIGLELSWFALRMLYAMSGVKSAR